MLTEKGLLVTKYSGNILRK